MTTSTLAPTAPAVVDLDTRLALADAAMNVRLADASAAIEVNIAHIAIDPIPHIDAALILTPAAKPNPYRTPVARLLWQAAQTLHSAGWCRDALTDEHGAVCLMGAIEAAAPGAGHTHDALAVLLEAIRRDFPHAESVPHWNDSRGTSFLAFRYLDQAAELAHARGI